MRENKWIILTIMPLSIVALLSALLCDAQGYTFLSNVMLGIFGSGILTVMVSFVNYWSMRRRTLEAFWSYGHKVIKCFNRYSAMDDLDNQIKELIEIADYDYQPFDDAYGDICFLFGEKEKRKEISKRIYAPIMEVRNAIGEHAFHFREYAKTKNGNRLAMQVFVSEIEPYLFEHIKYGGSDDKEANYMHGVIPYKVNQLYSEFNDYFYWIMYPWMKKEKENAN